MNNALTEYVLKHGKKRDKEKVEALIIRCAQLKYATIREVRR